MTNLSIIQSVTNEWSTFKSNERYYLIGLLTVLLSELWFNQVSPGLIYLFFFSSFFIKGFSRKAIFSKSDNLSILLMSFWGLYLLGLLWTTNLEEGLAKLDIKSALLILPITFSFPGKEDWKKWWPFLRDIFILAILLTFAICLLRAGYRSIMAGTIYESSSSNSIGSNMFTYSSFIYFIMHPGYMSMYVSVGVLMVWQRTQRWTFSNIALISTLLLFIVLLSSRGGLLALMVAAVVGLLYKVYQLKSKKLAIAALALPLFAYLGLLLAPEAITDRYINAFSSENLKVEPHQEEYTSVQTRIATWQSAKNLISDHVVLGVGPGDAKEELNAQYIKDGFDFGAEESFNTHNTFLQSQLSLGLLGSAYWVVFFVWAFVKGFKTANFMALTFTVLLAVGMLTESLLERNWGIFFFVFFSWLAYIASSVDKQEGHEKTKK